MAGRAGARCRGGAAARCHPGGAGGRAGRPRARCARPPLGRHVHDLWRPGGAGESHRQMGARAGDSIRRRGLPAHGELPELRGDLARHHAGGRGGGAAEHESRRPGAGALRARRRAAPRHRRSEFRRGSENDGPRPRAACHLLAGWRRRSRFPAVGHRHRAAGVRGTSRHRGALADDAGHGIADLYLGHHRPAQGRASATRG